MKIMQRKHIYTETSSMELYVLWCGNNFSSEIPIFCLGKGQVKF